MNFEIKLLLQMLSLAKHRNFARAAESLHISQPALSRSISNLEQTLGVQLFDRTSDGVVPTGYGRLILERGREIVAKENELQREIQLMEGIEIGELSIGAGPYPFEISVGPAVSRLIATYPKLQIKVETASPLAVVNRILGGSLDLGVADIREWHGEQRLTLEALPAHAGAFCCRPQHPLAGRRGLTLEEILAYPLVGTIFPPSLAGVLAQGQAGGRIDQDTGYFIPAVTVDSLSLARRITMGCDSILILTIGAIEREILAGDLVILDCRLPWMYTNYGFISKRDRSLSAVALEFMARLREVEAEIIERENALLASYFDCKANNHHPAAPIKMTKS
jgi:DNA-binding transcriptional LysR family regulator